MKAAAEGIPRAEETAQKWRDFSFGIIGVMGISILAVLVAVALVTAFEMGGLARAEQTRKAADRARFLGRILFVPMALEDTAAIDGLIGAYMDDPDMVRVSVMRADGELVAAKNSAGRASYRRHLIEASAPILPSLGGRGAPRGAKPAGFVTVELSLSRIYGVVTSSLLWIGAAAVLLFLVALAADLAMLARITRRLRELIGEAKLAEELQRSNRDLEQFAFVASHDLQEPLRKIVGFCQLLQQRYAGKLDPEADRIIEIIVSGGLRMGDLIRDLLSYARAGAQGKPLEPTDCAPIVRELLADAQDEMRRVGAEAVVDELPVVLGDAGQLRQVFQNLIGNALKFRGEEPPRIRVSCERREDWWQICVRDNGIGIDPRYRERIFEMFKRLHSRDKYPGTGIGLAICKKIVERHGGRIWVEPAPGEGAVFCFTLRAADGGK